MKMAIKNSSFSIFLVPFISFLAFASKGFEFETTVSEKGHWILLHCSIGISAMHMQVLNNNKVIMFDRTDFGPSNLSLPAHRCRIDPYDQASKIDCTAHSVLYDINSNTFRPLMVQTDTWCSSGAIDPDGTLIQTGGYNDGEYAARSFTPCDDDQCDWNEQPMYLSDHRWYATNQILPDGRIIIVGGRSVFSYEFYPKDSAHGSSTASYYLSFLRETRDPFEENNLYPFLHLLPDGNLFIFANKRSILLDYDRNRVLKEFPVMPGDDKRNYPSTGSSVLLPLRLKNASNSQLPESEVMVCGGAPAGAYTMANKRRVFLTASKSCGRLKLSDPKAKWVMEKMPMPRVVSDMLLLPTGDVLIINGASKGTAGWEEARKAVFSPVLYKPNEPNTTRRFVVLSPSGIARMYHSTAALVPDGRILVGGSNPHKYYNFTTRSYPTELSLEAFYPPYLAPSNEIFRPSILSVETMGMTVSYRQLFSVTFVLSVNHGPNKEITAALVAPSFTTHSFAMNQRVIFLEVLKMEKLSGFCYKVVVIGPTTASMAPPGYYMLFLVHAGIPSSAVWLKVQQSFASI